MPKKSTKDDDLRNIACKHLKTVNEISNSGLPLCFCVARNFNLSPYNIVCQVCALYKENNEGTTHTEMYVAAEVPNFQYDPNKFQRISQGYVEDTEDLEESEEEEPEDDEGDEEGGGPRVRSKKRKRAPREEIEEKEEEKETEEAEEEPEEEEAEEEPEEEEEFEEETEEEEAPIILGPEEATEKEEELDYEDEREEGLGKRHGLLDEEEEDEELEEEIEDIEEEVEEGEVPADEDLEEDADIEEEVEASGITIDFEVDVVSKIKKIGDKELCPYCGKSKSSVIRHLSKCKRVPPEVLTAYEAYKSNSKKKGGKVSEKDEDEDALDD